MKLLTYALIGLSCLTARAAIYQNDLTTQPNPAARLVITQIVQSLTSTGGISLTQATNVAQSVSAANIASSNVNYVPKQFGTANFLTLTNGTNFGRTNVFMVYKPELSAGNSNDAPWVKGFGEGSNPAPDTDVNKFFVDGFNYNPAGGTRYNSNENSLWWTMETRWDPFGGSAQTTFGNRQMEYYLSYIDRSNNFGALAVRPFSFTLRDTNLITAGFAVDNLVMDSAVYGGIDKIVFDLSGRDNTTAASMTIAGTINVDTNASNNGLLVMRGGAIQLFNKARNKGMSVYMDSNPGGQGYGDGNVVFEPPVGSILNILTFPNFQISPTVVTTTNLFVNGSNTVNGTETAASFTGNGSGGGYISLNSSNGNGNAFTFKAGLVASNLVLLAPTNGYAGQTPPMMLVVSNTVGDANGMTGQLHWVSQTAFVTSESSTAFQINSGVLTLSPGVASNLNSSSIDVPAGANVISNAANVLYQIQQPGITVSNLVVSPLTNNYECVGLTNIVLTNIVELATGINAKLKIAVRNTLGVSVPLVWPAYGAQHGFFLHTNGLNDVLSATVCPPGTNAVVGLEIDGTNVYPSVTFWRHP